MLVQTDLGGLRVALRCKIVYRFSHVGLVLARAIIEVVLAPQRPAPVTIHASGWPTSIFIGTPILARLPRLVNKVPRKCFSRHVQIPLVENPVR